jgi:2-polyprenyl-3-methyl-5-hydroxy-6-metoxy-1,4-benzoquinol methylase
MVCDTVRNASADRCQQPFVSTEGRPGRPVNRVARSVARTLLWPARRFFDPRFLGLHQAIQDVRTLEATAANEVLGRLDQLSQAFEQQTHSLGQQGRLVEAMHSQFDELHGRFLFDTSRSHSIDDLDEFTATVLNYAASNEGFAAQANLWFNPPVLVGYGSRRVVVQWVNERIVEVPYAFSALHSLGPGARVLDIGASESLVSLSLATLGYDVTALDPRPNPLSHERLRTVIGRIEDWDEEAEFDGVLCLSTIEHIGTEAYGQQTTERRADLDAMQRMRELTRPGGLLVLTTSVGEASADDFHRVYDRKGLDELLAGWNVEDLTLVQRQDETTWVRIDCPIETLPPEAETVAMITAIKKPH